MRAYQHLTKLAVITALFASLSMLMAGGASAASLWTTETTMPFPREAMAVVQAGDTIYTIGGYNEQGVSITDGYREIVEAYDLTTGEWTCSTDDPATTGCASKNLAPVLSRRWHTGAAAGNGKIYLLGGDSFTVSELATMEIYDIAGNSWSDGPPMPTARDNMAAAVGYDGKLYAIGGHGYPGGLATLEIYDPTSNSWSTGADMPAPRSALAAVTDPTGHKIYAIGGIDIGAPGEGQSVFVYDIDSNSWSTSTSMSTDRWVLGATFVGNHIYAIGGLYPDSTDLSAEAYDATRDAWGPVAEQMPGSDFRVKAFTGADGNIYVVTTSSRTIDTIYKLDTTDQTAPVTTATAKNTDDSSYSFGDWTSQDVTVTLSASDGDGSGVSKTYYTIDSGDTKTYSTPFKVSGTGTHTISYWSTDKLANIEATKTATVKIDTTAPATTASAKNADLTAYTSGDWTNQNVTVTLSATDGSGAGLDHISFTLDGGTTQVYSTAISLTTEGHHQLVYWSVDKAGNSETHRTFTIKIDKTPPTATSAFVNASNQTITANAAGWFNQAVSVKLTCSDPPLADSSAGSGIASCPSKLLDTEGADQSASLTVEDNAGNSSVVSASGIDIDLTDPVVSCGSADGAWHNDDVSISCSASDALSGLKNLGDAAFTLTTSVDPDTETADASTNTRTVCNAADRCVDAGPVTGNKIDTKGPTVTASASSNAQPYTSGSWTNHDVVVSFTCSDGGSGVDACIDPITISTEGTGQSASGNATDNVGNSTPASFTGINIDKTLPVTTAGASIPTGAYSWQSWTNQMVTVTLSATDSGGANISATYYAIDGNTPLTYAVPFDVTAEGQHTITFWSEDAAGNVESSQSVQIWIDKTAPVVTFSGNQSTYAVTDQVTITCTPSDSLSGIATSTCQDIDQPAYSFGVGSYTFSASATDLAGNSGEASVTFTVGVSAEGLCTLTGEMIDNQRVAGRLCAPLRLVEMADAMHNQRMKTSAINSYKLLVTTQGGRSLTADEVKLLIGLAEEL